MEEQENNDCRPSVKDMVKVFSETKRPIFLPKRALSKNNVSCSIPEEDSILPEDGTEERESSSDEYSSFEDDVIQEDSSTSDEDDLADQKEIFQFINAPEIVDEIKILLREEEAYCELLNDLTENYANELESEKLNVLDVFGRIDIISSYHNNTFLQDLKKSRNVLKITNCFLKHKNLFNTYYESYFKNQQNMMFVMDENREIFKANLSKEINKQYEETLLKGPNQRIEAYQTFFQRVRDSLCNYIDVSNFDRALEMIRNLTNNFSKKEETTFRFNISEIIETERLYVEKLENITQKLIPKIKNTIRSKPRHNSVVGNVPLIYVQQLSFYEDLKKCLFDFDPNEVAECFLRNKDNFLLYVKDQQMKNDPSAIEECKEILKKDNMDFHAPLNRLYKYKLLLQELKKSCQKGGLPSNRVEMASNMISDIISEINAAVAINAIVDENIYLNEQGKLILRGEFVIEYKTHEDDKPLGYDAMVYLFEKAIVFTEKQTEGHSRNRRDVYIYKNHIITKHLGIVVHDPSETAINLHFHGRTKKFFYTLHAQDESSKDDFKKALENILMQQLLEAKQYNA